MAFKDKLTSWERLDLIRVKIEQAKKHLTDLESEIALFRNHNIKTVVRNRDPQTGETVDDLKTFRRFPFGCLATAGDVIHNLRSALDHLANQLVSVGGGKIGSRRVQFPIAKDATTYEREKSGKVEGMTAEAIKAIDALKPYRGGNEPLWRIHELDNIDKHRMLLTTYKDTWLFAEWMDPEVMSPGFLLKAGDPTFAGVFDNEVEQDVDLEMAEAFSNPQLAKCDALLPSLHQLVDFVNDLVLSFEPLLR